MEGTEEVGQVEKWLEDELEEELEALQIILGDDVRHIQRYGKAPPLHSHPDVSPTTMLHPTLLYPNYFSRISYIVRVSRMRASCVLLHINLTNSTQLLS